MTLYGIKRERIDEIARGVGVKDRLGPDCHNAALDDSCGKPDPFVEIHEYAVDVATRAVEEATEGLRFELHRAATECATVNASYEIEHKELQIARRELAEARRLADMNLESAETFRRLLAEAEEAIREMSLRVGCLCLINRKSPSEPYAPCGECQRVDRLPAVRRARERGNK